MNVVLPAGRSASRLITEQIFTGTNQLRRLAVGTLISGARRMNNTMSGISATHAQQLSDLSKHPWVAPSYASCDQQQQPEQSPSASSACPPVSVTIKVKTDVGSKFVVSDCVCLYALVRFWQDVHLCSPFSTLLGRRSATIMTTRDGIVHVGDPEHLACCFNLRTQDQLWSALCSSLGDQIRAIDSAVIAAHTCVQREVGSVKTVSDSGTASVEAETALLEEGYTRGYESSDDRCDTGGSASTGSYSSEETGSSAYTSGSDDDDDESHGFNSTDEYTPEQERSGVVSLCENQTRGKVGAASQQELRDLSLPVGCVDQLADDTLAPWNFVLEEPDVQPSQRSPPDFMNTDA